jgi:hypothetical protein
LITAIINDIGNITDSLGTHTLTTNDFGSNGMVNWYGAKAYVDYLNHIHYEGYSTWSLPTSRQLATLFITNLGYTYPTSLQDSHNADYALFSNVQIGSFISYWSGMETPDFFYIYGDTFSFGYGGQYYDLKEFQNFTWIMLPGNVAAVPVPGAIWLFGAGLLSLLRLKRRDNVRAIGC